MVDLLSEGYDVICRYQGGNNAGHTVINDKGKFILNLLPSGVLRDKTINIMGPGMLIDIEHLCGEIDSLSEKGISLTPENLKISDGAFICLPYHKQLDILEEERLGDKKFGSTRRGIAPAYSDKYMKKNIRMRNLRNLESLRQRLADIIEWKNLTIKGYGNPKSEVNLQDVLDWLNTYGTKLIPYITDTGAYLSEAVHNGKGVLFEAQLGALRDIDYGIYPYTTSSQTLAAYATTGAGIPGAKLDRVIGVMKAYSSCVGEGTTSSQTLAAYAPIGAGAPGLKLDRVIGVMKAYSSCVGEGPFTAELFGDEAKALREAGGEYGAATGRPRRVGGFDIPASRYGVQVQGADEIALTKLDVLAYLDKIPVCAAYEIDGEVTSSFPFGDALAMAKPVYEYLEGFKTDISKCRKPQDLPKAALDYVKYIEKAVNCPIKYVSVGAEREDYIELIK